MISFSRPVMKMRPSLSMRAVSPVRIRILNALFHQQGKYCWVCELSSRLVLGLTWGTFRAIHRPEAPSVGLFWRLARVRAKGDGGLREGKAGRD